MTYFHEPNPEVVMNMPYHLFVNTWWHYNQRTKRMLAASSPGTSSDPFEKNIQHLDVSASRKKKDNVENTPAFMVQQPSNYTSRVSTDDAREFLARMNKAGS